MHILVTNDDGILAPGLRFLYKALLAAGHTVDVVAPATEQSGVGHAITLASPLRVKKYADGDFSGMGVFGTPVDSVKLGLSELLSRKPDIIASGINAGANVGPDIMYSGTVAAAREAAAMGYRALAVSHDSFAPADLGGYAAAAVSIMEHIPWSCIPPQRVLNLNLPAIPIQECKGLALCPQTSATWRDWYHKREDPRGIPYWWLDGAIPPEKVLSGTDREQLSAGWATLTPLRFDFTDSETMEALAQALRDNNNMQAHPLRFLAL